MRRTFFSQNRRTFSDIKFLPYKTQTSQEKKSPKRILSLLRSGMSDFMKQYSAFKGNLITMTEDSELRQNPILKICKKLNFKAEEKPHEKLLTE